MTFEITCNCGTRVRLREASCTFTYKYGVKAVLYSSYKGSCETCGRRYESQIDHARLGS